MNTILEAERTMHPAPGARRLATPPLNTLVAGRCRVRIWYGGTPISDFIADHDLAERYSAAMIRRLVDVRITTTPA
ncbi:hypothetical protein ACIBL3_39065 [Kribbella sp. NPDC050124]|uniref:hypothetical protein n=1 Tax=Kribbella sp. NPDC050124 TaxID=3364114 RepID=UPI0037AAAD82